MKSYTIRRTDTTRYADMSHTSDDPNFVVPIPQNNAGYRSENIWMTQLIYESLELDIADQIEEKKVIDRVYQELDLPVFEDMEGGFTAQEQETQFRLDNEIITVDSVEKYVIQELSHQEYRFPANYKVIVEDVIEEPVWERERRERYSKETDLLFQEAVREKIEGNEGKWTAYMVKVNKIKSDNPKPV